QFGVGLGDLRRAMPQHDSGRVQAGLASQLGGLGVSQLVGGPAVPLLPPLQLALLLVAQPGLPFLLCLFLKSSQRSWRRERFAAGSVDSAVVTADCVSLAGRLLRFLLPLPLCLTGRHGRLPVRLPLGVKSSPCFLRLEEELAGVLPQPRTQHLLPFRPDEDDAVGPTPGGLV